MSNKKKIHFNLLRRLDKDPGCTQRELAKEMGVSLGKLNYCLNSLIRKGLVKVVGFHGNPNKRSYSYLLTPSGIEEKARLTVQFLKAKIEEYNQLQQEIEKLQNEASGVADSDIKE